MTHPLHQRRGIRRAVVASVAVASTAFALAGAAPLAAQKAPTTPAARLERAAATYRGARTVDARFQQTLTNPITGRSTTASGELLHSRPNLLLVRFDAPAQDRVVSDGSSVWLYLPSSAPGQVVKMPAASAHQRGVVTDPLGQVLSMPASRYTAADAGTAQIGGHATHAVTVTPTSEASFTRATVWIDDADNSVRQIEIAEPSGLVRRVTITSLRTNVSIPRDTFRFTPPAGVRVIDQQAMIGG